MRRDRCLGRLIGKFLRSGNRSVAQSPGCCGYPFLSRGWNGPQGQGLRLVSHQSSVPISDDLPSSCHDRLRKPSERPEP